MWTMDSFGATCPTNWEEIVVAVNERIEAAPDTERAVLSERLWEQFCENDEICGVSAIWG